MAATMTDLVQITRSNGIQTLRISRPDKKNALTRPMYVAMAKALMAGDRDDDVSVHVFLGCDGVFTAGNDIEDFVGQSNEAPPRDTDHSDNDTFNFIALLPRVQKPMIAGVDGLAVGVGTTMLLHCDLVYATPEARFITPFLNLGVVPEAASSLLMPQRMGYAQAAEMLLLGEPFTAERMKDAGVVNAIVSSDKIEAVVLEAASKLAAKPPAALAKARQLMRGSLENIEATMKEELDAFSACMRSPEAQEAFAAFLEKRPPDFKKLRKTG